MTLERIFSEFSDRMAQKKIYQQVVKRLLDKEFNALNEYYELHKDNPRVIKNAEGYNMIFFNAKDGNFHYYAQIRKSVEDQVNTIVLHKNKQYQWLLAEAYEVFEDFLEKLYAYIGFLDYTLWPLVDFGNISFNEIANKEFNWYEERVKLKKDKPESILNQLRKIFPDINDIEERNYFKINLKLSITMIQMLRHIIVHKSGVVDDKNAFREKILKISGLFQNGKPKEVHTRFINAFFSKSENENNITLLEICNRSSEQMEPYVDRFDVLTGHLMSYANIFG